MRTGFPQDIVHLTGNELTEEVWDAFYNFYMDTGSRKWGRPYLRRPFFSLVGERIGQELRMIMAGARPAGALRAIETLGLDAPVLDESSRGEASLVRVEAVAGGSWFAAGLAAWALDRHPVPADGVGLLVDRWTRSLVLANREAVR